MTAKDSTTRTTSREDSGFVRTALVVKEKESDGSIDLVHANGEFLARINIFTNDDGSWLGVDVIDTSERFTDRTALVFNNGQRSAMHCYGRTIAADFRRKEA